MTEKIKLTFLGTSGAIPSAERNHTSILLTYKGENILLDCGEGTQRQFRKARLNPNKITRILITHWHGDHVLGIPGLLQTLSFSNYRKTLYIYGPRGTKKFMKELMKAFVFSGKLKMNIEEVSGKFFETKDFYLESKKMIHGVPCHAYTFVEKGKIKINKKKLKKTKLCGPILKKLKEGRNITYNGKKYSAKNLTFEEDGRKISFVFDTSFNKNITPFVRNSSLLVCESTFGPEFKEKAAQYKHLTVKQAAEIAKKSKSRKLVLTHISSRYSKNPKKILNAAKKIFKNSVLVKDLDVVEIK